MRTITEFLSVAVGYSAMSVNLRYNLNSNETAFGFLPVVRMYTEKSENYRYGLNTNDKQ